MVCELTTCQVPGVAGDTGGRLVPRAALMLLLKVRVILVCGVIWLPGAGAATALAADPAGNQLTTAGFEVSQLRGAAATIAVPASAVRFSRISLSGFRSTRRASCPGLP